MATAQSPDDFSQLPPSVRQEETLAHQREGEDRYGGPGGSGDAVDGDGE